MPAPPTRQVLKCDTCDALLIADRAFIATKKCPACGDGELHNTTASHISLHMGDERVPSVCFGGGGRSGGKRGGPAVGVARRFDTWDVALAAISSIVPAAIAIWWYLNWGDWHPVMAVGFIIATSIIPVHGWWTLLVRPLRAVRAHQKRGDAARDMRTARDRRHGTRGEAAG